MSSDRIEKSVVLKAPRERVWQAISDASQFGRWFGMEVDGAFVAGQSVPCRMRPTEVDAAIAKDQECYAGMPFEVDVVALEPMTRFAFRWHAYGVDEVDPTGELKTLVEFVLSDAPEGTRLDITESGFDRIPLEQRAKAFAMNEGGWEAQAGLVKKFVEG